MAAQTTTLKRLRLSRWMMMGTDTAPAATAAAVAGASNKMANKGSARANSTGPVSAIASEHAASTWGTCLLRAQNRYFFLASRCAR